MRLKSFYGPTMTEVMQSVREQLGEDAIIVATRDDEMGGVRVTVAIEETPVHTSSKNYAPASPDDIQEDKQASESIELIARALLEHNVPQGLAERLLATATQYASEDPLLSLGAALDMHFSYENLPEEGPAKPIILIGPPGAGKTLCTAKLAARASMHDVPFAIISTDTERAGGMAQLAAITRILEKDILEIEDVHALQDAVAIQKKDALVYIDTAGCNPFDQSALARLAEQVKLSGAEPLLVLPADQDSSEGTDMAKAFESIGAKRILFTRLDMTRRMGGIMRTAFETELPFCHFSCTGRVSEAPAPMNPVSLARLVLPKNSTQKQKTDVRSA